MTLAFGRLHPHRPARPAGRKERRVDTVTLVRIDRDRLFGTGPWHWTSTLRPGSGDDLRSWLAEIPLDTRYGLVSPFRRRPALIRRRDLTGADYFVLARPGQLWSEQYSLRTEGDSVSVMQTLSSGQRAYLEFFLGVSGLLGLGGLVGAVVTWDASLLLLLGFPAFARLWVVPLIRDQWRSHAKVFFAELTGTPVPRL
jgi:hypothetical protein